MDKAAEEHPDAAGRLGDEQFGEVRRVLINAIREKFGKVDGAPRGTGIKRWEKPLAKVGLAAPKGRPILDGMALALTEMIQLRHVIVHRAARVTAEALDKAPSLPHPHGDLVCIDRAGYKRYSAALWTYAEEILHRMGFDASALDYWAMNYTMNA
jgi:hypothetical protein